MTIDSDSAPGPIRFPTGLPVPPPLRAASFVLEPLGPEHNERDHQAWMSSIEHIRATDGFAPGDWGVDPWPRPMSLEQNLSDLIMHAAEFADGVAFAYSVVDPDDAVVGCVYVDPDPAVPGVPAAAMVRSWVRADRADLDEPLASAVHQWLLSQWAFSSIRWPGRVVA
jgi:hypothetical protein